jgi:cobyrinic acid a,c-diamide synthase
MQPSPRLDYPRLILSALRGGAGKTTLSIGIIGALKSLGRPVSPFKKGPDYIDAGWLALAAGRPCYNLDSYLLRPESLLQSFHSHTSADCIAVIEGNRGLYDGIDMEGSTSTAELAKLIQAPVVLCLDCTKTTRTGAAAVLGCMMFDPETPLCAVILNRVSGKRHERMVQKSIEYHCGIPVLGALPKLDEQHFPERHMGLVPTQEHAWANLALEEATRLALAHIDLKWLIEIADSAAALPLPSYLANDPEEFPGNHTLSSPQTDPVRIGVIRDSAFQFYYPENLEALERCGATLTYISALEDIPLPPMDALYIGGGFPETHAERLAANAAFRNTIRTLAEDGMPIYAECGGLMFLGQSLVIGNARYPMAGVLPIVFGLFKRPQGHGYTEMLVDQPNPFYSIGTILKGHEFHYSKALECPEGQTVFAMKRGSGLLADRDGFCMHQTLATYTHIHALGTPQWAPSLIENAKAYHRKKSKSANALIV